MEGDLEPLADSHASSHRDVEAILAIQAVSPEIAQWTMWDYERVAQGEMAGWVAEEAGEVIGFLIARQVVSDMEILNLAVPPRRAAHGRWRVSPGDMPSIGAGHSTPRRSFSKCAPPTSRPCNFTSGIIFMRRAGARAITPRRVTTRSCSP